MQLPTTALALATLLLSAGMAVAQTTGTAGGSGGTSTGSSPATGSSATGAAASGTTGSTAGASTPGSSQTHCANADPLDTTAMELGCLQQP